MNKQQIYKQSKLIAEFMGFETHTDVVDDRTLAYYVGDVIKADNSKNENEDDIFHPEDMQFHTSWDWLMPVVCKIDDHFGDMTSNIRILTDDDINDQINKINNAVLQFDREILHRAVVEFITDKQV